MPRKDEFHCLSKGTWEEVTVKQGPRKGLFPIVGKSGSAFVANDAIGEEVRVFRMKKEEKKQT